MNLEHNTARIERAIAIVQRMPDAEQRLGQIVNLASALLDVAPARASEILQQALQLVDCVETAAARMHWLASLARTAFQVDATLGSRILDRAFAILRLTDRSTDRRQGLCVLAGATSPDRPEFLEVIRALVVEARRLPSLDQRANELLSLADYVRCGNVDEAEALVNEAELLTEQVRDEQERSQLMARIAWVLCGPTAPPL